MDYVSFILEINFEKQQLLSKVRNYWMVKIPQDLSKYTVPTSFVGMSVPTTVVGMLVVSALPTKVVGMLYVIFSIKDKKIKILHSFYG